jgi:hypothetical protein
LPTRAVIVLGALLVAAGLAVFTWKVVLLDMPLLPSLPAGVWRVELEVTARGSGGRGSVRAALPASGPGQTIFDETASADRLDFSIRSERGERTGLWTGRLSGNHEILYGFRVELSGLEIPLPESAAEATDAPSEWTTSTSELPAQAPEILERVESLNLPGKTDPNGRIRLLLAFVSDEIGTAPTGSDDALLTLAAREGNPDGKVRLLVSMLRAAGFAARTVAGLRLREGEPLRESWAQVNAAGRWVPLSPVHGTLGKKPADLLQLRVGSMSLVSATGVEAVAHRYRALREHLRPEELNAMMIPPNPLLADLSLYRLPVPTQMALRGLLLLPLGALATAFFRNVIGVPTFGTFMPVLIAFALRYTSLGPGLLMIAGVLSVGIVGRLAMDRLRLLLVPRLSLLLCIVVLAAVGIALAGRGLEGRELYGAILFPMVILTMLIERFTVTLAEEGTRPAFIKAGNSTVVAVAIYPLFRSSVAEHVMFGFPELVISIMGLLVWIGGYMGYRVSELIRFQSLARTPDGEMP